MNIVNSACLLLLFVAVCFAVPDTHNVTRTKCAGKYDISPKKLEEGLHSPKGFGEYLYCYLQDINAMNDASGYVNASAAVAAARADSNIFSKIVKGPINHCADEVNKKIEKGELKNDGTVTSVKLSECLKKHAPRSYKLFGIFKKSGKAPDESRFRFLLDLIFG